jgi:methyltransferase OMS1, mitochondrial
MISGSLFCFAVSYYYASYRKVLQRPLPTSQDIPELDITSIYNRTARSFDDDQNSFESVSGIAKLRKKLVQQAEGHVLECAVGTGRNSTYYDAHKVRSLTMVDRSPGMLAVCQEKWNTGNWSLRAKVKTSFLVGDLGRDGAEAILRPNGEEADRKFDVVVQTMGLCSTEDPVKLLRNLGRTVKSDGKILMLEHGISHYAWVNELLHRTALDHAKEHGCWWNRDIGAIVEKSGLEVDQIKRYNFGTTWWLELRPSTGPKSDLTRGQSKDMTSVLDPAPLRKYRPVPAEWWPTWR